MTHVRTMWRAIATSALILTATAVAAGCAADPAAQPARVIPGPTPTTTDITRLHLPIEQYMLTPAQSLRYDLVSTAVLRTCMRRYGFDYPAADGAPANAVNVAQYAVMYRRYGVTDLASVRTWGYHLPRSVAAAGPAKPDTALRDVLRGQGTTTRAITHNGRPVPADGCLGEARRLVDGGVPGTVQGPGTATSGIVATIKADSFARSMADQAVTDVFARWSTCMAGYGFHIADPMHAADRLDSIDAPVPNRQEIAQAVADVTCKVQTNLVGIWFAVESAYQQVAISAHRRELAQLSQDRDKLVRRLDELSRAHPA